MTSEQIIQKINEAAQEKGLNIPKLGKITGVSLSTIRNTLTGSNSPTLATLIDICTALGYEVNIVKQSKSK